MTEAPSIKEALEIVENLIRRDPACFNLSDELLPVRSTLRALATFQPDGERLEAIARAICTAKGVNPDCLHQNYDDNEPIDHTDAKGRTYHYGWRNQLHIADAAILASGLVQNEAGIRADERIFQPIGYTEVGKMIDAGIKAVDLYNIASTDILRRTDIRAFLEAALAIRSARDGGAE